MQKIVLIYTESIQPCTFIVYNCIITLWVGINVFSFHLFSFHFFFIRVYCGFKLLFVKVANFNFECILSLTIIYPDKNVVVASQIKM